LVKLVADAAAFALMFVPGGEGAGEELEEEAAEAEAGAETPPTGDSSASKPTTPNQMNQQAWKGQAPKSVDQVHSPRFPYEKPHVEFKDGNALNNDGTWKHGGRALTNVEKEWLTKNGWKLPND
jgi:hypothetical protein